MILVTMLAVYYLLFKAGWFVNCFHAFEQIGSPLIAACLLKNADKLSVPYPELKIMI